MNFVATRSTFHLLWITFLRYFFKNDKIKLIIKESDNITNKINLSKKIEQIKRSVPGYLVVNLISLFSSSDETKGPPPPTA